MTDFQACADDHVDTSSSVTSACYICRSCLSSPKGRRTLDSVSEQNRKAVSFIERFVTEVPYQPSSQFVYIYANLGFQELIKLDVLRRKLKKLSTHLESRFVVVHLLQSNL